MADETLHDEELGQALGYVRWAEEMCTNIQGDEGYKEELVQALKSHKASGFSESKEIIHQLRNLIHKKQVQQIAMKEEVYAHIQKTVAEKISLFENMHAELFARDVAYKVQQVHQQTTLLSDVLVREEKLLTALNPESFEHLIPHLLFLCEKEKRLKENNKDTTTALHKNTLKLLGHMSSNYFDRLAKLAETKEFHEDHHELFMGTYLLSNLARTVIKAEGLDASELLEKEQQFTKHLTI